jgi:serine protease AprX
MESRDQLICPLCNDKVDRLIYQFHLENEKVVIGKIKDDHPEWSMEDGLCSRCVDYYHAAIIRDQMILPEIGPYFPVRSVDDFVILPTGLRLNADPRYTGKGVTICFIDSGFSLHPDLLNNPSRIKKMIDLTVESPSPEKRNENTDAAWHGTMTTVVCAGSGLLSRGLYRGIASDALLVLLKVQDENGKIHDAYIIRAFEWLLQNHKFYGIRIVNISLGSDRPDIWQESKIDLLAEALIAEGVVIVSAAGNDDTRQIYPPANSPNVIAVGGIDDGNLLGNGHTTNYHSSYSRTAEGINKPELVAHAIWIAAPILQNTGEHQEAASLFAQLENLQQGKQQFTALQKRDAGFSEQEDHPSATDIIRRIQEKKFISPHYQHVDGTSFAAPVVSAVVGQLLEANPELTPAHIRSILFNSA